MMKKKEEKKETDRFSLGLWQQHPHQNCPWPLPLPATTNKKTATQLIPWTHLSLCSASIRKAFTLLRFSQVLRGLSRGLYLLQGGGLHGCGARSEWGGMSRTRGLLPSRAAGLVCAQFYVCIWRKKACSFMFQTFYRLAVISCCKKFHKFKFRFIVVAFGDQQHLHPALSLFWWLTAYVYS